MKILIGVCGGIAAYKAADLVSKLVQNNHEVNVCMTPNAENFHIRINIYWTYW